MGFSASWIAVRGLKPDAALEALGLEIVSQGHAHPEGRYSLVELASGWTVVWFEDVDAAFKADGRILAQLGEAVACSVEEHVMVSEARGYVDGKEAWRVRRDADDDDLETSGDVPARYAAIRDAALAEQAKDDNDDVDLLWEVPPDLAKAICGFRHDEMVGPGETFLELRRAKRGHRGGGAPASSGGFWRRLFGGR